jgi:hypothetical protein
METKRPSAGALLLGLVRWDVFLRGPCRAAHPWTALQSRVAAGLDRAQFGVPAGGLPHREPPLMNPAAIALSTTLAIVVLWTKRRYRVRLNGADHQWGKDPLKEVVG